MAKLVHNVQKKQHRERSQTLERARFGLLEKKKDYKLRATDYHKKQAAIKALKAKASSYNPDEYYHGMTLRLTDSRGIIVSDRGNEALSTGQVKLMKSQDVNYIRTMRLSEQAKIDKQRQNLNFGSQGQHTVFVDSYEQQKELKPEIFFDTDRSLVTRRENRLKVDQLETRERVATVNEEDQEFRNMKKLKQYKLMKRRIQREAELRQVEGRMDAQKELMKKGSKKKIVSADGKVLFKWKNQRKK